VKLGIRKCLVYLSGSVEAEWPKFLLLSTKGFVFLLCELWTLSHLDFPFRTKDKGTSTQNREIKPFGDLQYSTFAWYRKYSSCQYWFGALWSAIITIMTVDDRNPESVPPVIEAHLRENEALGLRPSKHFRFEIPTRYVMAILAFFGFLLNYMLRINMSIAIVAMVRRNSR